MPEREVTHRALAENEEGVGEERNLCGSNEATPRFGSGCTHVFKVVIAGTATTRDVSQWVELAPREGRARLSFGACTLSVSQAGMVRTHSQGVETRPAARSALEERARGGGVGVHAPQRMGTKKREGAKRKAAGSGHSSGMPASGTYWDDTTMYITEGGVHCG